MRITRPSALSSRLASCGLLLALAGCGEPPPPPGQHATPRKDDPELVHTWQMPADKSVLMAGDLGSKPPALADALMKGGAPGIGHRSATACAEKGALAGTSSVALRLSIAEGGAVASLEGDPAGTAATCLVDAVRAELGTLDPLPAGAALMVLRFHAAGPR